MARPGVDGVRGGGERRASRGRGRAGSRAVVNGGHRGAWAGGFGGRVGGMRRRGVGERAGGGDDDRARGRPRRRWRRRSRRGRPRRRWRRRSRPTLRTAPRPRTPTPPPRSSASSAEPALYPAVAAAPRAFARMSAICSSIQSPGSREVTISFNPASRRARLLRAHRQRRVDRVRQLLHVERVDRQRELAQLLVRARVLAQDRDPVALVDQRPLLGHQVHPVEHRVDDHHVVVLVGGDRLVQVVAQLQVDRHPVRRAVAVVDHGHQRLDPLQVLGVLGHVLPRGHQLRRERDPLAELGVLLEEDVEAGEPAQDVLRQVGTVHAQDRELAPAPQQLLLELGHAGPRRHRSRRLVVDRQRIRPHPHLVAVLAVHDAGLHVDLEVHQVAAALEEVAPVGARVEADDVVGQEPAVDLLAHPRREHAPGVRLRPRDVDEVVQEDVRLLVADHARERVEVVVVDHHDRGLLVRDLLEQRPSRGPG